MTNGVWAGGLTGLLAVAITVATAQVTDPPITDPMRLGAAGILLVRPSRFSPPPEQLLLQVGLSLGYLVGLGLVSAALLLKRDRARATGGQAFGAGYLAGLINAGATLPMAALGGGLTGVFLWLPGALVSPFVIGCVAWATFAVTKRQPRGERIACDVPVE